MAAITSCRRFNGTSDYITFSTPSVLLQAHGPLTWAAVIKANADPPESGYRDIVTLQGGSGGQWGFMFANGGAGPGFLMYMDSGGFESGDDYQASDGWAVVGVSKPDGNGVDGRTHVYPYGTATWTHASVGAGAVNEGTAPAGSPVLRVGTWNGSIEFLSADVAVIAFWRNRQLSDAEFETLASGIAAWDALNPDLLWLFDQASTATTILDRTSNNADQTAISGTSVVTPTGLTFDDGTSAYVNAVLADAPRVYYRMNEASGLIQDSSGNGRHAASSSGTAVYSQTGAITSDPSDTGIYFDGDPTYFVVTDHADLDLGNVWSIECWVKRAAISAAFENIIDKGLQAWAMGIEADGQIQIASGGTAALANSTVAITDTTTWHHVVGTKNGATTKIYIDNVECSTNNLDVTTIDNATNVRIGDTTFTGSPINARLDEVALYSTALSAARVEAHYLAAFAAVAEKQSFYVARRRMVRR